MPGPTYIPILVAPIGGSHKPRYVCNTNLTYNAYADCRERQSDANVATIFFVLYLAALFAVILLFVNYAGKGRRA